MMTSAQEGQQPYRRHWSNELSQRKAVNLFLFIDSQNQGEICGFRLEASLFKWPHSPLWKERERPLLAVPQLGQASTLPLSPYSGHWPQESGPGQRLLASPEPLASLLSWRIGLWSVWANKIWGRVCWRLLGKGFFTFLKEFLEAYFLLGQG